VCPREEGHRKVDTCGVKEERGRKTDIEEARDLALPRVLVSY